MRPQSYERYTDWYDMLHLEIFGDRHFTGSPNDLFQGFCPGSQDSLWRDDCMSCFSSCCTKSLEKKAPISLYLQVGKDFGNLDIPVGPRLSRGEKQRCVEESG